MGIVQQLQKEAMDDNVGIETLLRKAYLVARKLQLKEFEEWVSKEQEGFSENIPDYRMVSFQIKAWNPYRGWIPVILPGEYADKLTRFPVSFPMSTISDLYQKCDGEFALSVPGELTEVLNQNTSVAFPTQYSFRAANVELHRIMSIVRNRILEWSLLLEENGICGEDLSFSEKEIHTAHESKTINNYTNNFYSLADHTEIKQGGE